MSFSRQVKNELARVISTKECCNKSEFIAFLRMDGQLEISTKQQIAISLTTENHAVARKLYKLARDLFTVTAEIIVHRKSTLKKNQVFVVRIPPQAGIKEILKELGFKKNASLWDIARAGQALPDLLPKPCCKRAYLRGCFLGGGSINNPEGSSYHLELICNNMSHANFILKILDTFDLTGNISERKNKFVVYIKNSEKIVDFLNIVGAHKALLEFENIRIMKEMRNNVNRIVNCETANMSKAIDAGLRQAAAIKKIEASIGIKNLPQNLQEIAWLRLDHPQHSFKELGSMLNPPLGKSGVNHRLRKIEEIADNLN